MTHFHEWCIVDESCPLGLVCEVGGKFHQKTSVDLGPIVYKYHEGKVKQGFGQSDTNA